MTKMIKFNTKMKKLIIKLFKIKKDKEKNIFI